MFDVLFKCPDEDYHTSKASKGKQPLYAINNEVHDALKDSWRNIESEKHFIELVYSEARDKGDFIFSVILNFELLVSVVSVYCRENSCLACRDSTFVHTLNWIQVSFSNGVAFAIVIIVSKNLVFFGDKDYEVADLVCSGSMVFSACILSILVLSDF